MDKSVDLHKMGQSVYEIIEGNNNEAYAKLGETARQPQTVIDASSLGRLGDAIKSQFSPRKAGIEADRIDDLILYASQRKLPSSPFRSSSAPLTAASPSMAPGIGGFNIDAPMQRARLAKGDIAIAHMQPPASPRRDLVFQAPLQAQRIAVIVESDEPSLVPRLLAIMSDSLQTIAPLCNFSSEAGFANELSSLGVALRDPSAHDR
jgi:hypothetical protein